MNFDKAFFCIIILSVTFFLITFLGNRIIKQFLPPDIQSTPNGNGARIGNLERLLYFISIIFQNWSLLAIVLGLKTIARYKKLEEQKFSEYFLIGSFSSLLYSIIISAIFLYFINLNSCIWLENKFTNIQIVEIKSN